MVQVVSIKGFHPVQFVVEETQSSHNFLDNL